MRRIALVAPAVTCLLALTAGFAVAFPQPPEKKEPVPRPEVSAASADSAAADADSAAANADRAAANADSAAARGDRAAVSPAPASKERRRAEALYAQGYDDAKQAARLAASGKSKDARKRYERALRRFDEAVRLDDRYFEAWNMLGYCARQTGDLERSFDAYDRCLALDPDYEPAHEYRGEAYLMNGEIEKARAELQWLRERESPQAALLQSAIEAAERDAPGAVAPGGSW